MPKVTVTEPIHTERLVLRPFTETDLDDVYAYQSLPEVVEFMLWELRTREQSREHLARRLPMTSLEHDNDILVLAVVLPGEPSLRADDTGIAGGPAGATTSSVTTATAAGATNSGPGETTPGRVIGDLTVFLRSVANKQAELGWAFHPDFQHRGYATEAAERMLDFAFTELDAHRVTADLDPRNDASAALAKRLGMRQEAHFREDIFTKGAFADTAIFAILRNEWTARRAQRA
ncbi:GNAT family N-acetyltransferase [Subtercola endophyticus]|uniref:GNAT family N-acetyltransferase n=1 Tax=Subtercola endophyticus TaxID=2895559 RepID=UPI001E5BE004|nr:GNAT family protein [Subtercola endophyticus]UFS58408.1 GNAT family N-acetyltransferase [Subtercola endophyticus]